MIFSTPNFEIVEQDLQPPGQLEFYETKIREFLKVTQDALLIVKTIKDKKLYKQTGLTWDEYCKQHLGKTSRQWAYLAQWLNTQDLIGTGIPVINVTVSKALNKYTDINPQLIPFLARLAHTGALIAGRDAMNSGDVHRAWEVVKRLWDYGTIEVEGQDASALEAQLTTEQYENMMRQREHLRGTGKSSRESFTFEANNPATSPFLAFIAEYGINPRQGLEIASIRFYIDYKDQS